MALGDIGAGFEFRPNVKRKVFVSYHHGNDQAYYDTFSRVFHDTYEVITDNSLERKVESYDVDYVMRRIRENYIMGTSCTIVLVGASTWGRKYVDWEIKASLDKKNAIIGVHLPSLLPNINGRVTVPGRLFDNITSGYALWVRWHDFTQSSKACARYIEQANTSDKRLIVNTRERLLRNA